MPWIPLLSTIFGAVLGLGSGLLTDHFRSGRERTEKILTARRDAYVAYLSALHDANGAMREIARGDHSPGVTRASAARAAFRDASVTQAREHIVLMAPEPVVAAADATYQSLRVLRDRIAEGQRPAGYERQLAAYGDHLQSLRQEIRKDLQVTGPIPRIPL